MDPGERIPVLRWAAPAGGPRIPLRRWLAPDRELRIPLRRWLAWDREPQIPLRRWVAPDPGRRIPSRPRVRLGRRVRILRWRASRANSLCRGRGSRSDRASAPARRPRAPTGAGAREALALIRLEPRAARAASGRRAGARSGPGPGLRRAGDGVEGAAVRRLVLAAGTRERARLGDRTHLLLVGPAELEVIASSPELLEVSLTRGTLVGHYQHGAGGRLRIRSPGTRTDVVGTTFYVEAQASGSRVAVSEGRVLVRGAGARDRWSPPARSGPAPTPRCERAPGRAAAWPLRLAGSSRRGRGDHTRQPTARGADAPAGPLPRTIARSPVRRARCRPATGAGGQRNGSPALAHGAGAAPARAAPAAPRTASVRRSAARSRRRSGIPFLRRARSRAIAAIETPPLLLRFRRRPDSAPTGG